MNNYKKLWLRLLSAEILLKIMKEYEITFITKEPFDTAPSIKLGASQGKDLKDSPVKKEIESLGGKILSTSSIGQKQFTYKIKKETAGTYSSAIFEIEPEKVNELNNKLVLKPEILRHLIIITRAVKIPLESAPKPIVEKIAAPEEKLELPEVEEKPALPTPVETIKEELKEKVKKPTEKKLVEAKKPVKEKLFEKEKPASKPAIKEEDISPDDRLKALDKKLDELLKE